MTDSHDLEVLDDRDALVHRVAEELERALAGVQTAGRVPQLGLTGGTVAADVYAHLGERAEAGRSVVDWARVELWWSDERFVGREDADRNAVQLWQAIDGRLPLDPSLVHETPASDDTDLDAAAAAYAAELGDTRFDVCLLGLGPDGHVASLFPGHPGLDALGRVIAVRDSPKPPPERLSTTFDVINSSAEVWLVVSGAEKAAAVRGVLTGDRDLPGTHAHGTTRTRLLCDRAASAG